MYAAHQPVIPNLDEFQNAVSDVLGDGVHASFICAADFNIVNKK
jgi:hypothetical protein